MTLQIGRFGQSPTVRSAAAWDGQGDRATVSVPVVNTTLGEVMALRQQALGMVGDVVPVVWTADPTVDGYYRVADVSFPMNPASARYDTLFTASFELERVISYAAPLWESQLIGATLTNGLGSVGAPFHALPDGSPKNPRSQTSSVESATRSVQGPDGTTGLMFLNFFSTYSVFARWRMPPDDYYWGAATLEHFDGTSWRPVTGTQVEGEDATDFRLQNGMTRCTVTNEGSEGNLEVSHWDGSQFDTAKDYRIEAVGAYVLANWSTLSVIRNSPEEVTVRLATVTDDGIITVDLTLRRGDRVVRGYLQSESSRTWKILRDTGEAASTMQGAVHATANDASGNRFILATTHGTHDLVNGGVARASAGTTFDFGISSEVGGTSATGTNAAAGTRGIVAQYFASQSERMALAGR